MAVLAVKLFALFVSFDGLRGLLHGLEFIVAGGVGVRVLLATGVVSSLVVIALGCLIWVRADSVAARMLGERRKSPEELDAEAADDEINLDLTGLDAHAIGFTMLGVFLVAEGIGRALFALGYWLESLTAPQMTPGGGVTGFVNVRPGQILSDALSAAALLLIGLALSFGARSLAAYFRRVWWRGRGVVRTRRIELVDLGDVVRAQLTIDETDGGDEDVALTFFDDEARSRLTIGTDEGEIPAIRFLDETGRSVLRLPAV